MNTTTQKILQMLEERKDSFLSGEEICQAFSISRTAVWKHINSLKKLGYGIESMARKGYQLSHNIELPLPEELKLLINDSVFSTHIEYLEQATSTNQILMQMADQGAPSGLLLIAEQQSAGHGRMQRQWHSPPGENLYFSTMIRPEIIPHKAPQLSLVVAAAIYVSLKKLYPKLDVAVKWPNDIFLSGKKVAGVLCEMQTDMTSVKHVVIGIGINVNSVEFPEELKEIATSVAIETGAQSSRCQLLAEIINTLDQLYMEWLSGGLAPMIPLLNSASMLTGKEVTINLPASSYKAKVIGIDAHGFLEVETTDGIKSVPSGEVSLSDYR